MATQRYRIAVIGAGAAGLTAAYLLQRRHTVTLYEKSPILGGHAQTILLDHGPDAGLALDVGFMVLNRRNYPTMYRLLGQLEGIELGDCEMSFGYYAPAEGAGYVVNRSRRAAPPACVEKSAVRDLLPDLLPEIMCFCRQAVGDLEAENLAEMSLGDYLGQHCIAAACVRRYVVAMGAAIWSTPPAEMLAFPAQSFLRFLNNHGMLGQQPPQWQYIKGGSCRYVQAMARRLDGCVRAGVEVEQVVRGHDGVRIHVRGSAPQEYDLVVLAVHGDQALRLLADPTELERHTLAAWKYQRNDGYLHSDESVMPPQRRLWASWNYRETQSGERGELLQVTYHLNRLQGHENAKQPYFVTLNPTQPIAEDKIVRPLRFTHPTFSLAALRGRDTLLGHNGAKRTYYCGSYCGYGFHEDAIKSGVAVAAALGVEL